MGQSLAPYQNGDSEGSSSQTEHEAWFSQRHGAWSWGATCCQEGEGNAGVATCVQVCPAISTPHSLEAQLAVPEVGSGAGLVLTRSAFLAPHLQRRFQNHYMLGKKIGFGSFGDVHEAIALPLVPAMGQLSGCTPDNDAPRAYGGQRAPREVAVKVFRLMCTNVEGPGQKWDDSNEKRASFRAEQMMLATLEHPHIVRMHECFQEQEALYLVLELCRGGELFERVQAACVGGCTGLGEPLARRLFKQMLQAVGYLHSRRITHRDLKALAHMHTAIAHLCPAIKQKPCIRCTWAWGHARDVP
mmetsp:Transcript_92515/g.257707  ORF Transcript_92515/g.257707 Transcript_92515/m.257707 type:complete len:301 (+) Transcript_92515:61-963(+)